ncbi:MAG: type II toxin-antitoxin system VapC family toxin [Gammaproteobacteria bacterium]|nr:type II toxin-antitoxin system VapC family toxin [Gammaproteobacteria bacterium]
MNVVDSSAWLSYFAGDKNSGQFAKPIEAIDKLLVPSITLTEVFKCILRQRNKESAFEAIAHMEQGTVIPLDSNIAINAASFGVELKLPLADSIIYATARKFNAIVWTQDADFKNLSDVKFYPRAKGT